MSFLNGTTATIQRSSVFETSGDGIYAEGEFSSVDLSGVLIEGSEANGITVVDADQLSTGHAIANNGSMVSSQIYRSGRRGFCLKSRGKLAGHTDRGQRNRCLGSWRSVELGIGSTFATTMRATLTRMRSQILSMSESS